MDQPLGRAVGNALEIAEVLDTLDGNGPPDLVELVVGASAHLLALSDLGVDVDEGRRRAQEALGDGAARDRYERWVRAQDGDPRREALPTAAVIRPVPAPASGYVGAIATTAVGRAALHLGAGRVRKEDAIDHAVGVVCLAKRGDPVESGTPIAEIHARDEEAAARAVDEVTAAYSIVDTAPQRRPIVLEVLS
jgi:thymidine phosphorylase